MVMTIAIIFVATIAVGAFEIWLIWRVGERDDRRRRRHQPSAAGSAAGHGARHDIGASRIP